MAGCLLNLALGGGIFFKKINEVLGTYLAYILESSRLLVHILGNTYVVCVLLNDYYANSST